MTHRLLVNPGTPQAWEIVLKPGVNRIGRGEHNDFKVAHGSVSTSHCEINVSSAGVLIKDLGSTNGTQLEAQPLAPPNPGRPRDHGILQAVFPRSS